MRSKLVAFAVAGVVASPSLAHAFADATQFFANPRQAHAATLGASGEGLYFTGAPRFASRTCADCHVGGPQVLGLKLGADDQSLFATGYVAGKTYHLQVELQNETEGTQYGGATCTDPPGPTDTYSYVQCNYNGFALEIDGGGGPIGAFCATAPAMDGTCAKPSDTDETLVAPDGDAIFHNQPHSTDPNTPYLNLRNDPKVWDLWWTAPKAGSGPVTVYVAGVDGNGGTGMPSNDQDTDGDDTVEATFFIQESGAPVPSGASAGCTVSGANDCGWWGWLAIVLLAVGRRRAHGTVGRGA